MLKLFSVIAQMFSPPSLAKRGWGRFKSTFLPDCGQAGILLFQRGKFSQGRTTYQIISEGLLILCMAIVPLFADDVEAKKKEIDENMDELNSQLKPETLSEEADILDILKKIQDKMLEAADGLSTTSDWKAIEKQEEAKLSIEEIIKKQKEAVENLEKMLKGIQAKQKKAIDDITKLIKLAREMQQQSESSQPQKQKPQKTQKQPSKQQPNASNPATQPYEANATPPGVGRHVGGETDRWGNLPPKVRDAILLSKSQDFTIEYQEWLERYFKILAGETR
jgi:chemotaxis protein histidine kinase CheA